MANRNESAGERRLRVDGGLVAAAIVISVFLWTLIYLINKAALV